MAAGASFESLVEMALMMDVGKAEDSKEVATTAKAKEGKKEWWRNKKNKKKDNGPQKQIKKDAPKCHGCGSTGHLIKDCKRKGKIRCFLCDQPGHISRVCPQRARQGSA